MDQLVNVGIVGLGPMGVGLAQGVVSSGMGRIVAAVDIDSERASAFEHEFNCRMMASMDELFACPDIQAVIIAVPNHLHCESVLKAAAAGKQVFVEKPMALTTEDCDRMIQAVTAAGTTLMVGHVLRYCEPFKTLLKWQAGGQLGKLLNVSVWRTGDDAYTRSADWRTSKKLSGGYLFEVGIHEVDFLRCLAGEPAAVYASVKGSRSPEHEIEDAVSVHLDFGSGLAATYLGGTGFTRGGYGFQLRYENAVIKAESPFTAERIIVEAADGYQVDVGDICFSGSNPVEDEIRYWLESIINGTLPPITGVDARRTIAIAEAAYRSAELGQVVHLSDEPGL